MADWTYITENEDVQAYTDLSKVSKQGTMVRLLMMFDWNTVQENSIGDRYLSRIQYDEYDCPRGRSRIISFSIFSDNMGGGDNIFSYETPMSWSYVASDSLADDIMKVACDKQ